MRSMLPVLFVVACTPTSPKVRIDVSRFAQGMVLDLTLAMICGDGNPLELAVTRDGDDFTATAPRCGNAVLQLTLFNVAGGDRVTAAAAAVAVALDKDEVEVPFVATPFGEADVYTSADCTAVLDEGELQALTAADRSRLALVTGTHVLDCDGTKQAFIVEMGQRATVVMGAVSDLMVTVVDAHTAILSWEGGAPSFDALVGVDGVTGVTGHSVPLTSLNAGTDYKAIIVAHAADGTIVGVSNEVAFRTPSAGRMLVRSTFLPEYPYDTTMVSGDLVFDGPLTGVSVVADNGAFGMVTSEDQLTWHVSANGLQPDTTYTVTLNHAEGSYPLVIVVAPYRLFVGGPSASSSNDGSSPLLALDTVEAALVLRASVAATLPTEIRVAGGSYVANATLQVPAFTQLRGGWTQDFAIRDNATTTLQAPMVPTPPTLAVIDALATPQNTLVDGFVIEGAGGSSLAAGVEIAQGAAPTLSHLDISSGTPSDGSCYALRVINNAAPRVSDSLLDPRGTVCMTAYGLYVSGGAGVYDNNRINAGNYGFGFAVYASTAPGFVLSRNYILGVAGGVSTNVAAQVSGPAVIYNNAIHAGNASASSSMTALAVGAPTGDHMDIVNNVVDAGAATFTATALTINVPGGDYYIANNVFYHNGAASSVTLVQETVIANPVTNHNLFATDIGAIYQTTQGNYDINQLNARIDGAATGNALAALDLFVARGPTNTTLAEWRGNDFHLVNPLAGDDASAAISGALDLDATARVAPWCIGVYEQL